MNSASAFRPFIIPSIGSRQYRLQGWGAFIFFAMRQDVNLVHEDYYEKGVDYNHQMEVDARSAGFRDSIRVQMDEEWMRINLAATLAASIDSGNLLFFRPSSSSLDLSMPFRQVDSPLMIPRTGLIPGRYILKVNWFVGGLEYQVDETLIIQ